LKRTRATFFLRLAAIAALLCLSGCSVHQKFPAQQVATQIPLEDKLPLKIAVYADPEFTFGYPRVANLVVFTEVMNPGFADTLHNAFNSNFHAVTVIDKQTVEADIDLIASPKLNLSDPMKLTILFIEPKTRRLVTEISAQRPFEANAPGMYANLITDVVLFAAVVAFPPSDVVVTHAIRKHDAERFNAIFVPAVAKMAGDISIQASRDPRLCAFAAKMPLPPPALNHL
jgi:hypothetical protein